MLCLLYRLGSLSSSLDYTRDEATWRTAVNLAEKCSFVGSVWIAIKYHGLRPCVPDAETMALVANWTPQDVIEQEAKDLQAISWDIRRFVTTV